MSIFTRRKVTIPTIPPDKCMSCNYEVKTLVNKGRRHGWMIEYYCCLNRRFVADNCPDYEPKECD